MSRNFYSDYVNHCLRFYARYPAPHFKSVADEKNWDACDKAMDDFSYVESNMLKEIYLSQRNLPDLIENVANKHNTTPDNLWRLINELEEKVAKARGLI